MLTVPSIITSVENKDVLVLDNHARNGAFEKDVKGRLLRFTGGFSIVFPYKTVNGEKWAFRCWHSHIKDSKKRYEAVSDTIKKTHLSFLCEFQYIDKGICVEGNIYPTTRMRWIEGAKLNDYIWQNKGSKDLLKALANDFLKMTQALHERNLAHGDLQHGNILVDEHNHLYLVDYDSFYCPELKGEPDTVTGLPDYQHPSRIINKSVSEKLDYFSELIIYLSILAVAENPSLADRYKIKEERLLFSKEDYKDITNSPIYWDIHALGGDFIGLLKILEDYLRCKDINELRPFETLLIESKIQFSSTATKAIRNKQQIRISWYIPFKADVSIAKKGKGDSQVCKNFGSIDATLAETTTYELTVKAENCNAVTKQLRIDVFDECEIEFSADKYYIFPGIPVTLTWNVKHAKTVWFNNVIVSNEGRKVVEPTKATTYVIVAENEFSYKEKKVDIQMLPIPQVKSLLVPAPNIASNLSLSIQQPKLSVGVRFPKINLGFIATEPPIVPSLTDLGIKVELIKPRREFNIFKILHKLYDFIKQ